MFSKEEYIYKHLIINILENQEQHSVQFKRTFSSSQMSRTKLVSVLP